MLVVHGTKVLHASPISEPRGSVVVAERKNNLSAVVSLISPSGLSFEASAALAA